MIRLFTTYYDESDPKRDGELRECLRRNCANDAIDEVWVLNEGGDLAKFEELHEIPIDGRPTYGDFFGAINERTGPDDINVVVNADIYFPEDFGRIERCISHGVCFALTRYEVDEDEDATAHLHEKYGSQDAWIFRGKVREEVDGNVPIGIPGCDARMAHELCEGGYRVKNPCLSIRTFHLHASARRTYQQTSQVQRVDGPYRVLPHRNLHSWPRTQWNRLFRPERYWPYRLNRYGACRMLGECRKAPGRCKAHLLEIIDRFAGDSWLRRAAGGVYRRLFERWVPKRACIESMLEEFVMSRDSITLVHVGAYDGVARDPLGEGMLDEKFQGLLIEPSPGAFEALRERFEANEGLEFENCVVGSETGQAEFYLIPYGSRYAPCSTLSGETLRYYQARKHPDILRQHRVVPRPTKPLNRLLEEHDVDQMDLLRISTVATEYEILRGLDFDRWRPAAILFRCCDLRDDSKACYKLLHRLGYTTYKDDDEALALQDPLIGGTGQKKRTKN
jgi:FkbM family methyltransferase